MATVNVRLDHQCAGGGHVALAVRLNGNLRGIHEFNFDELVESVTEDEEKTFARILYKIAKVGRTNAQVRTVFENIGVDVTV